METPVDLVSFIEFNVTTSSLFPIGVDSGEYETGTDMPISMSSVISDDSAFSRGGDIISVLYKSATSAVDKA